MMTPGVGDVLSPLAKSAVDNLKLGYPAVSPNASMDLKLKVYDELASEAQDCYRRRPVREYGEDFQRAIAEYRRACKNGTPVFDGAPHAGRYRQYRACGENSATRRMALQVRSGRG